MWSIHSCGDWGNSISGSGNSKYKGPGQECGPLGKLSLRNKTQATEANTEQAPGRQADRKPRFQAGPRACRAPCQGIVHIAIATNIW